MTAPTYRVEVEVKPAGWPDDGKPVYQVIENDNGHEKCVARWGSRANANRDRKRFETRAHETYGGTK